VVNNSKDCISCDTPFKSHN